MTEEEASAVYDVLVRECGADEGASRHMGRARFVEAFTRRSGHAPDEWGVYGDSRRKICTFYCGHGYVPPSVSLDGVDETPERRAMIERANAALEALRR